MFFLVLFNRKLRRGKFSGCTEGRLLFKTRHPVPTYFNLGLLFTPLLGVFQNLPAQKSKLACFLLKSKYVLTMFDDRIFNENFVFHTEEWNCAEWPLQNSLAF